MHELVMVTGATGGIGSATCDRLADAGFAPIVCYRTNRDRAEQIARETKGEPLFLDLSKPESIDDAVAMLETKGPVVAGLIHAASPAPTIAPFTRVGHDELLNQLTVNALSFHRLTGQLIKRFFKPQRRGFVIGVLSQAMGSESGQGAMGSMSAYIAAKYAQGGVLAAMRAEYPWLEVFSVRPSYTDTAMLEAFDSRFVEMQRVQGMVSTPDAVAREILAKLSKA